MRGRPPVERQTAAEWLAAYLANGPVPATQVRRAALAAGLSLHTLRRAADDMGVARSHPRGGRTCRWATPGGVRGAS